jgi:uncharacterized protein YeaO (DUF488 family)
LKRAYEPAARGDGYRVLVERLWPRGVRKDDLTLDDWFKDLAPSTELRTWFAHDVDRWNEFRRRYRAELAASPAADVLRALARRAATRTVTLVYAARDPQHNSAVVLKDVLQKAAPRH